MKENTFQSKLIKKLKKTYPNAIILKNDSSYIQGIPDLMILIDNFWAALECKIDHNNLASRRPNQEYYVNKMAEMSFARFISPENEKEVLNELEQSYQRRARR